LLGLLSLVLVLLLVVVVVVVSGCLSTSQLC
jgi:hypothetical protein